MSKVSTTHGLELAGVHLKQNSNQYNDLVC